MSDVYLHFDRSLFEGHCSIIMYSCNFERSDVRRFILVCALVSHYYFIAWLVLMFNSRAILSAVIFIDYLLFSLLYRSPISNMLYIEYHISSKDELSWGCFQCCVVCTSDAICCGRQYSIPFKIEIFRILQVQGTYHITQGLMYSFDDRVSLWICCCGHLYFDAILFLTELSFEFFAYKFFSPVHYYSGRPGVST